MTDLEVNTFAPGKYWNHDPNDIASAEDINNGFNHPDSVRDIACTHHPAGSNCNYNLKGQCGCNCFKVVYNVLVLHFIWLIVFLVHIQC